MKIIKINRNNATIQLSARNLAILANAINEAQEAVEKWEFSTRVGANFADAEALRKEIKTLLTLMKQEDNIHVHKNGV